GGRNTPARPHPPTPPPPAGGRGGGGAAAAPPSVAKNFSASDVARCDPPVRGHSYNGGRYHASSHSGSEAVVSKYFPVCRRKRTALSANAAIAAPRVGS